MLDRRPFWGIIIWLNFCVILWLFTIQEPFMPETVSNSEIPIQQIQRQQQQQQQQQQQTIQHLQHQQQQQQNYGKHLLAERRTSASGNAELLQYALESSSAGGGGGGDQASNASNRYKYQIHETSRDDRRLNTNRNNINLALNNNSNNNVTHNNKIVKQPAWSTASDGGAQQSLEMPTYNTATPFGDIVRPSDAQQDERQLIDLNDFTYLMTQPACDEKVQALILVHTAPNNVAKRTLIRQTWGGSEIMSRGPLRLLFLLGAVAPNHTLQYKIEQEEALHNDLVQGSFHDDYRNMTYKHVMALKWFNYNCAHAKILLKVDDDVFVNTPLLLQYVERQAASAAAFSVGGIDSAQLNNNSSIISTSTSTSTSSEVTGDADKRVKMALHELLFQQPHDLLFCHRFVGARVKRSYRSKWRVSFQEYAERYYPPYCPGYAIIYSADVVAKLYKAAQQANYFWIDDVMVTGVLAQRTATSITQLKPYVLFSEMCTALLCGQKDINAVEFLFSWHSISPEEIRALWALYTGDANANVSASSLAGSDSGSDAGSGTIEGLADGQNAYSTHTKW